MPTYDYKCDSGHVFERFCSISAKEADPNPPCPWVETEGSVACGLRSRQILSSMPALNNTEIYILDYPGSKRLKAGYVHSHVDPGPTKVSSGFGGCLNPSTAPLHPLAEKVSPDWKNRKRATETPR